MPSYGKENFKESNVNYLNKDFTSLKNSLIRYAQSYFPNSYRDFNETSPGMMLIEMNAYVGDVLSFYIDQQYREMLLPLAEERRNIITMAKMFGYKVKPIVPAYVELEFSQDLDAMDNDASKVDYTTGGIFDRGVQVKGSNNVIVFETLDVLDFQISQSNDTEIVASTEGDSGLANSYTLKRTTRAISGKEKTTTFQINSPEKFKRITLSDTNVIDIISCVDSNGNNWYEVDFLAQDKVPISTHYTEDNRTSAYQNLTTGTNETLAVPYSLSYITTTKRFTRETNLDNTTSLVFGNGVLRDGNLIDSNYIDMEQVGVVVAGQSQDLNQAIDPLLGDEYSTLGETPNNTTLTITYRVGGGINSNVPSADLNTVSTGNTLEGSGGSLSDLSVTNNTPARGGKNEETTDEIKEKAKAFFTTQNRCVTKEDYEARVMNIPAKYGNVAKVYVSRNENADVNFDREVFANALTNVTNNLNNHRNQLLNYLDNLTGIVNNEGTSLEVDDIVQFSNIITQFGLGGTGTDSQNTSQLDVYLDVLNLAGQQAYSYELSSINIYILAYNNNKQLVGNPMTSYANSSVTDNIPGVLMSNIKNYLSNFKILTDTIQILDGYIVNFGVFFDVVAEKYANKRQVKIRCIDKIKNYFRIEKMQFNQPIYQSQLEYELMDVEGVRSVNHVTISQHKDYHPNSNGEELNFKTWNYSYSDDVDTDGNPENGISGGFQANGTAGFGYKYDFENALVDGIIRPPLPSSPSVFELKNPNQTIKGKVR